MSWFFDLIQNPFLIIPLSSWLITQLVKVIVHAVVYRKIEFSRLFGDGGMPSGHSATVCALATVSALFFGVASFSFAFSFLFALVVCHDAMGVRRETGKQAVVINELVSILQSKTLSADEKLKEFVGHSPLQVWVGGLLGIGNAVFLYFVFF